MSDANGSGDRLELPEGWVWHRLEDIAKTSSGGTPLRSRAEYYDDGGTPWVKIGDLSDGKVGKTEMGITSAGLRNSSAEVLPAGTLLVAMYGSIGKLGILEMEAATNQAVCAVRPTRGVVERDYLFWYLRSQRERLLAAGYGGTQANISQRFLRALPIPVPPLREQTAIVDSIERLHSALNEAIRSLEQANTRLSGYRAASYASAFSGGSLGLTPGGEVLLESVAMIQSGITKGRPRDGAGSEVPYLRTANVQAGFLDLDEVKLIRVTAEQRARHQLRDGDVLVLEGGDADKVGRGWLWEQQFDECLHQNHVFAVRPGLRLRTKFLAHYVNAPSARAYFVSVAKQTTNLASINKANLKALSVPMFSLDEQDRLIEDLDQKLEFADHVGGSINAARLQIDELRRSALYHAFQGKLRSLESFPAPLSDAAASG